MRPARRTPPRWWLLGPSAAALVVVVVILATRWGAVTASQPAYLLTLLFIGVAAAVGLGSSLVRLRDRPAPERPRWRVVTARVAGVVATAVVLLGLLWLRPLPATDVAVASMAGSPSVRVVDSTSTIALDPTGHTTRTGLVFYPGALVDPRAYVPLLSTLAARGFTVVVVKPPYNIAFLATGAPTGIIAGHRSVTRWVVGGHSLGGVAASSYAGGGHTGVDGLLLWASYPASSLADATSLAVTSVSAGNDGLATPAKIEAAKGDLPAHTRYVVVEGAVHAYFGDYGTQRGDGTPTIGRTEAQRQIEAASLDLLQRVDEGAGG